MLLKIAATLLLATPATAEQMLCRVYQKINVLTGSAYTPEELEALQFSVMLNTNSQTISRCSFSRSDGTVTCDDYRIDRIEETTTVFVDIVKFYYFAGQFDLQIFNGLNFIENNGRGLIAIGTCSNI